MPREIRERQEQLQNQGAIPGPQASVLPAIQGTQQAIAATQNAFGARLAAIERTNATLVANAQRAGNFNTQAQRRLDPDMPGNLPTGRTG
jgi:hypothetical protein